MLRLKKYAALPNVLAVLYFSLYVGWLQFHHGHDPLDYLNGGGQPPRVVLEGVHCHNSVAKHPLFESHRLRIKPPSGCLLCTFSNWQFFQLSGAISAFENFPRNAVAAPSRLAPESTPEKSYDPRAPPFLSRFTA